VTALVPVFAVICLGFILRRTGFLDEGFWPQAERMIYYILFPPLLITSILGAPMNGEGILLMGLAMALGVLAVAAILALARPLLTRVFRLDGPAFTSVLQGSIRPNTFVGLATAQALLGDQGLALAAVAILALVPLVNFLSVLALSLHGAKKKSGLTPLLAELGKNPLLLSVLVGFGLNVSDLPLPEVLVEFLRLVSRAALPLGLLAVGAGLRSRGLMDGFGLGLSLAMKLLALPAATLALLLLFEVDGPARDAAMIFSIIPCAPSAYILARQLGGDERLMAAIVTLGVAAAAVTMPLWLAVL